MKKSLLMSFILLFSSGSAWALKGPLFSKGAESFRVVDSQTGQTPQYKIFHDSVTKKAVALSLNTILKLEAKDKSAVDVRIEGILFKPLKSSSTQAGIVLIVSGKEFEIDPTVNKADLQSGKTIEVKIKSQDDEVGPTTLSSKGSFVLRFKADQDILYIDRGYARFSFDDLLGDEQVEELKLTGKGIRL
jgi:hypothetical protein